MSLGDEGDYGTLERGAGGRRKGLNVMEGGEAAAHALRSVGCDELLLGFVVRLEGVCCGGDGGW